MRPTQWMMLALVLNWTNCGYSEPQMQAQRDQISGCKSALEDVATSASTYQQTIATLTVQNELLREQLERCQR